MSDNRDIFQLVLLNLNSIELTGHSRNMHLFCPQDNSTVSPPPACNIQHCPLTFRSAVLGGKFKSCAVKKARRNERLSSRHCSDIRELLVKNTIPLLDMTGFRVLIQNDLEQMWSLCARLRTPGGRNSHDDWM